MDTKQIVGYVLAGLGLVAIAFSSKIASLKFLAFLGTKATIYIIIASIALIVVGIVLIMATGGKARQEKEEVPIYKGKKIVGYRKE